MSKSDDKLNNSIDENRRLHDDSHVEAERDRNRLLSSIFFGLLNQVDDRFHQPDETNESVVGSPDTRALTNVSSIQDNRNQLGNDVVDGEVSIPAPSETKIDGALNLIENLIPRDPIMLRQTSLYKDTLQMLQWQRDNYLVGNEYADWRKSDRQRKEQYRQRFNINRPIDSYDIPYNKKTISHHQLSELASNFIPTDTVKNLLTPIITDLFDRETGILFSPIKQSTVNLILDQQSLLAQTFKGQVLGFLDNPNNRDAMKNSTQGMILQQSQVDEIVSS